MIVRKQSIRFDGNRVSVPRSVRVGYEGDHLVERLIFEVPRIGEEQSVFLVTDGEYADVVQLEQDADGRYAVDLTAEMLGEGGAVDCWVQVRGEDGAVWNSGVLRMRVGELPDADGDLIDREPTIVEQVTQAAQQAEDAAQRAEDAAQEAQNAMKDAARLDDGAVSSESTWSSAALIARMCPEFSESGAVVNCHPVAGSMLGVVSQFSSACEGVTLVHHGKNFFDPDDYQGDSMTLYGVTFVKNGDGSLTVNGTCTGATHDANDFVLLGGTLATETDKWFKTPGTYTLSGCPDANGAIRLFAHIRDADGGNRYINSVGGGTTFTLNAGEYMKIAVRFTRALIAENLRIYPLLERGSVCTEFEPYRGEEYEAAFGETVYGGEYDWNTGVLTVTQDEAGNALDVPRTVQLEGRTIAAWEGVNHLYGSAEETQVGGRTNLVHVIDSLAARIAALEAAAVNGN